MAPIHPRLHQTPMLISGPTASQALESLQNLQMDVALQGQTIGKASSIKMMRSIAVKGLEALTTELAWAAQAAGVEDQVYASLDASFPGFDWRKRSAYNLERMTTHGIRRAEEMREVVKTIQDLGHQPLTTQGTVSRQQELGELGLKLDEAGDLQDSVASVAKALKPA